jgi:two-component system, cell cycle response regulator
MRILVVDDDAVIRRTLEALLTTRGWGVICAADGEQAYALLQTEDAPKFAIIDWMMPGMSGPELCRKLRDTDQTSHTHVIMLTGRARTEDMIVGSDSGADDFVAKPVNIHELDARTRPAPRLILRQEQVRTQGTIDELTAIPNRAAIRNVLRQAWSQAAREKRSCSIALCDVDRFKSVNDTYGHPTGDSVLRAIARRLAEHLRAYDVVGRYGGEEFLIVLPGCPVQEAFAVMERMRGHVASDRIDTSAGPLRVTASFGVATGDGSQTLDDLVSDADTALYRAKAAGRNCVRGPDVVWSRSSTQ